LFDAILDASNIETKEGEVHSPSTEDTFDFSYMDEK
jgi:hypothetical protein